MTSKESEKKKFTTEETRDLIEVFRHLLDAYGVFAEKLGKIQKTHKEAYESTFSLEAAEKLPEMFSLMADKAPPELSKLFTTIFVRMAAFLPRISRLMDLSADEKIKLGKNLKTLAKDFGKLLDWIEKMERK